MLLCWLRALLCCVGVRVCGVPVSAERIMGTVEGGGCGEIRMVDGINTRSWDTPRLSSALLLGAHFSFSRFNKS